MKELLKEKEIVDTENCDANNKVSIDEMQTALNYWLLENMKIMEKLGSGAEVRG